MTLKAFFINFLFNLDIKKPKIIELEFSKIEKWKTVSSSLVKRLQFWKRHFRCWLISRKKKNNFAKIFDLLDGVFDCNQCDKIRVFLKVYCNEFSKNTTKNYGNYLIKPHFWSENCYGYFLGQLWKNFAYFYSNIWPHCNLQLMTFGKLHENVLLDKLKLIYLWILNNLALYEN